MIHHFKGKLPWSLKERGKRGHLTRPNAGAWIPKSWKRISLRTHRKWLSPRALGFWKTGHPWLRHENHHVPPVVGGQNPSPVGTVGMDETLGQGYTSCQLLQLMQDSGVDQYSWPLTFPFGKYHRFSFPTNGHLPFA